jgi:hypothetical protein
VNESLVKSSRLIDKTINPLSFLITKHVKISCMRFTLCKTKRCLSLTITLLLIIAAASFYIYVMRIPTSEGNWVDYAANATRAEVSDTKVTLTNIRDWQYDKNGPIDKTWHDKVTVDPRTLTDAWFLLEPFSAIPLIGHTFLSFSFEDGTVLSFSIEARREWGEDYSTILGLFNEYELNYAWGTERDFITRRLFMHEHPLYLYRLNISQKDGIAVFKTLAEATDELTQHPRFYNTLTANCTNLLAKTINAKYHKSLPYNPAWNFPGLSDRFLINQGYIEASGDIAFIRAGVSLDIKKESIAAVQYENPVLFSQTIRDLLGYSK